LQLAAATAFQPSWPEANEFVRQTARITGGVPMSMITKTLFNVLGTAHILGGCPMGSSAGDGVVDHRHRVFDYQNMFICDGSVLSANLDVNPSFTITALAERAMSFIPPATTGNAP
jgi:cholesterol oxidase